MILAPLVYLVFDDSDSAFSRSFLHRQELGE